MYDSSRFERMPLLRPIIRSDSTLWSGVDIEETDEGGERWTLYYWVANTGKVPAYKLSYYHTLSTQDTIPPPNDSLFSKQWKQLVAFPGDVVECGYDQVLRQQVLDSFHVKRRYYRHFFLRFEDDMKTPYTYHSVWKLENYEPGKPPKFDLRGWRRLEID